jgi:hypothetical protein
MAAPVGNGKSVRPVGWRRERARKEGKHDTAEEGRLPRRHLLERVAVTEPCDELGADGFLPAEEFL